MAHKQAQPEPRRRVLSTPECIQSGGATAAGAGQARTRACGELRDSESWCGACCKRAATSCLGGKRLNTIPRAATFCRATPPCFQKRLSARAPPPFLNGVRAPAHDTPHGKRTMKPTPASLKHAVPSH